MRKERSAWLVLAGICVVACMDAINGTALGVSRGQIMGGLGSTPDEAAWFNVVYVAAKLTAFPLTAWLVARFGYRRCLVVATLAVVAASLVGGLTGDSYLFLAARAVQGAGGGILLVAGQALLFELFARERQGLVQALFALAAVMAPNTIAPALQGWLADTMSWSYIFFADVPIGLLGLGLILAGLRDGRPLESGIAADRLGLALLAPGMLCLAFVLQEGSRWDWFEAPRIALFTISGAAALTFFIVRQIRMQGRDALIDASVFRDANFAFGFVASFVAGFALFASAFLIPAFAQAILGFPALQAGLLVLPSGALIALGLLAAGALIQMRKVAPFKLVPVGIALFMLAMWLLSGRTSESGFHDLAAPLLVRGLGLGVLFVTLTILTLIDLDRRRMIHGIALFNLGRQVGGLVGVAFVQTLLDQRMALHWTTLASHVTTANPALIEERTRIAGLLVANGQDPGQALAIALSVVQRAVQTQASVLSFDDAFLALVFLFIFAAPLLIAFRRVQQSRNGSRHADEARAMPPILSPPPAHAA